ncbi:MAG: tetratricopeptide repeat protein [Bacteroides sp.]
MNEQTINQQYTQIQLLIYQKRLKEALTQLEAYLWSCSDWELNNRFKNAQTEYTYMLQYMQQGMVDPERDKFYTKIQVETLAITDQVRLLLLDGVSNHYYHACRKNQLPELASYTLHKQRLFLEKLTGELEISKQQPDFKLEEAIIRHEHTLEFVFLRTWSNSAWTAQDANEAQELLQSEQLLLNDLCLFTSAVTLSLLECFDLRKLLWLMDAYQRADVQVSQRALVGMVFTFHQYADRLLLYPEIQCRIETLNEEFPLDEDLICIQQQFFLCQETEKIDKKMREEIIPEMLKNVSALRDMKFGFEESDEEKDDRNPDWKDLFDQAGMSDKMKEMNDLQMEGADVNMSTFSALKNYPFFRKPHNWFYPFDWKHPSIIKLVPEKGEKNSIIHLILQSGFLCNSDKYSLFFIMQSFPRSQREAVFSQLTDQQMESCAGQSNAGNLKNYSERSATVSNLYLHDLYRFFKLNDQKQEFTDIFQEKLQLYNLPVLRDILQSPDLLFNLANYQLKKEHWEETVELYQAIEKKKVSTYFTDEFYQRMGYALQKLNRRKEAIAAYQKADTLKPDSAWTNRHLATCYRMMEDYEQALNYYRKVEATAPENKNIVFRLAHCLTELQRYDEAMNYFFKLDFLEDNSIKAWRGIGWCSFVTRKLEQSIKYYSKIIALKPLPIDYLNAGHVHWAAGNFVQAVDLYRQAANLIGSRETFVERFYQDKDILCQLGIAENDIPLMLDLL